MALVTISPNTLCQEIAGEVVLLNLESESYFSLDETGTRIWQLLLSQADISAVAAQMSSEYDVDEARLREDIARVIRELTEAGLVKLDSGPR